VNKVILFAQTIYTLMESNKSIVEVLESMDFTIIYKKKKSVFTSVIYLLLGTAMLVVNSILTWEPNSVISPLFFMVGLIFLVVAVFSFFFRKYSFVSTENNQVLKSHSMYFDLNELNKLVRLVEGSYLSELKALKPSIAHALKLQVLMTDDARLCFSQVVSFMNHEYVNITPVKQHSQTEAQELLKIINRK
jgi:hypothetical protein